MKITVCTPTFNENFSKDDSIIWHQADGDVRATSRLLNKINITLN